MSSSSQLFAKKNHGPFLSGADEAVSRAERKLWINVVPAKIVNHRFLNASRMSRARMLLKVLNPLGLKDFHFLKCRSNKYRQS